MATKARHQFGQAAASFMVVVVLLVGVAQSASWELVYSEDFSSDPGWTTNSSSHFHWVPLDGTYSATQVNIPGGGEFAYYDTDSYDGGSFRLVWDQQILACQYASGVAFGLFDEDLNTNENGSFAEVAFTLVDEGAVVYLISMNTDDVGKNIWAPNQFSYGTWYRIVMEYDPDGGMLTADITVSDTGHRFVSLILSDVGSFSTDMCHVGSSNVREGSFQEPGAQSQGTFDNVELYIPVTPVQQGSWSAIKALYR